LTVELLPRSSAVRFGLRRSCEQVRPVHRTEKGQARRARYEESQRGGFIRHTYEFSSRRRSLRLAAQDAADTERHGGLLLLNPAGEPVPLDPIVPRQTVAALNRHRETLRTIERCGGLDMYRVD
jgi:hypothetical protein